MAISLGSSKNNPGAPTADELDQRVLLARPGTERPVPAVEELESFHAEKIGGSLGLFDPLLHRAPSPRLAPSQVDDTDAASGRSQLR